MGRGPLRGVRLAAIAFAVAGFSMYELTYAPIANVADAVHYHLAARLGLLRWTDPAAFDREAHRLKEMGDRLAAQGLNPHISRNFRFACVTYSFAEIPAYGIVDALGPLRARFGHPLYVWDVLSLWAFWLALLLVLLIQRGRGRSEPLLEAAWFLAAGTFCGAVMLDGAPFLPLPRGVSVLATGAAAALWGEGRFRAATALLVFGALAHPYQQILNLGCFPVFLAAWRKDPVSDLFRADTWRLAAAAGIPAAAAYGMVFLFSHPLLLAAWKSTPPLPPSDPEAVAGAWNAFRRVLRVGIVLVPLLWYRRGVRPAAFFAVLFAGIFGGLWAARIPEAELFLLRIGNAFLPPLLYILLQENLFTRLLALGGPNRGRILAAAAAAAAVLTGIYFKGFQVPATLRIYPYADVPPHMQEQTRLLLDYLERKE